MSRDNLHLFNPENDLALALGCRHYTPSPHASQLHRAGALLPAWWQGSNDSILAPYPDIDEDASWLRSRWGINCSLGLPDGDFRPSPWGWSGDTVRQFSLAGVGAHLLPTKGDIARMRALSHRRSSIHIISALGERSLLPEEITDPLTAVAIEEKCPGHFFKSPWSCSGRGVFCAKGLAPKVLFDKASGIIHRQGSILAEKGFDKKSDFGALFKSDGQEVRFMGLSMFITESRGAYSGNIVASQDYFRQRLTDIGIYNELETSITRLESILTTLLTPVYRGWLGIDMMAYNDSHGNVCLHPCIELNMRMTMGVVAMEIDRRLSLHYPTIVGWRKTTDHDDKAALLKPTEGFALTLSRYV